MSRWATQITWDDVPHLDDEAKAAIIESYLPHERDARSKGIPALGAGAIYPISESELVCDPIEFPLWYKHVFGMDVGWNKTAAIWGALDPETDVLYLYSEYYRGQAEPPIHAEAIKSRGVWIPGVIDPAARGRAQKDGEQLFSIYQRLGLKLTTADNAVEAGIYKVWTRMSTGRLKIFRTLQSLLAEFRIYRRDDKGKPIKDMDHLLDSLKYLCATGVDLATPVPYEYWPKNAAGFRGLPIRNHPKHQVEYNPMSAAWSPQQQQQSNQPGNFQPWMPHSPGNVR